MLAAVALLSLLHHTALEIVPGLGVMRWSRPSIVRRLIAAPSATVTSSDGDDDDDFDSEDEDEAFLRAFDLSLRRAAAGMPIDGSRADSVGRGPQGAFRSTNNGDRRFTPLDGVRSAIDDGRASFNAYTESPSQQFLLGSLALLVGFYVSHAQFLGGGDQGGRWEYVSGAAATYVVERLTSGYHEIPMQRRSPTLKLLHAFKVGFVYGVVLDAIKFGG